MLVGLSVTDMNGKRISIGRALLRLLLKVISGFIFGLAYLVCLFTEHKQTLHDIVIGTLVWKSAKSEATADLKLPPGKS